MRAASAIVAVAFLAVGVAVAGPLSAAEDGVDATAGFFFKIPLNKDLQVDRGQEAEFGVNLGSKNIQKSRNKVTYQSRWEQHERAGWEALSLRLGDQGVPELSLAGRDAPSGFNQGISLSNGWPGSATAPSSAVNSGVENNGLDVTSTTFGAREVTGTPSRFHPRPREGITLYNVQSPDATQ